MTLDTVCIELTLRCPLRCVHCSACAGPARSETANVDTVRRWLESQPRLREIYLSGGEPFEHPALEAIAEAAIERADRVILYSSGVTKAGKFLGPLDYRQLKGLAEQGVTRVDISLYSAWPEQHDRITFTAGSLDVALESCRRVRRAGLELGVHFVPLPGVDACLAEVLDLSRVLGATRLHVLAPVRQGRGARIPSPLSRHFLSDLVRLMSIPGDIEWVISSAIRGMLGSFQRSERDTWRSGFIDVRGLMHPGEGARTQWQRTVLPVIHIDGSLSPLAP